MSPSDKKDYALITQTMRPRLRRTVNTRHYSLPKPYRRKGLPEEHPRWTRKLAFYVGSGVLIGTLVALIADQAESHRRERALPIIAAPSPSPGEPAPVPVMNAQPAALLSQAPGEIGEAGPAPLKAAGAAPVKHKPVRLAQPEAAPAPDPDVDLIAAILTLAPAILAESAPAAGACTDAVPHAPVCAQIPGLVP